MQHAKANVSAGTGRRESVQPSSVVGKVSTTLAEGWRALVHPAPDNNAALDGARSLAVILVIASHVAYQWQVALPDISALRSPFYYFGWSGVDLFFVLSGLLIGGQIWKELERTKQLNFKRFFLKRAFRIWPLYFAFLAFLTAIRGPYSPTWSDWLLLSNYFPSSYERGWSLSTEEHFYLVAPLLCLLHFRFIGAKKSAIVGSIAFVLVAVLAGRFFTAERLALEGVATHRIKDLMYYPFHLHNEGLVVGVTLAYARLHWGDMLSSRSPKTGIAVRAGFVMVVMMIAGLGLRAFNNVLFPFLALGLVYGGLVWWLLADRSWLSSPFRWRPWHIVARLSFGMYLNHLVWPHIGLDIVSWSAARLGHTSLALATATLLATLVSASVALVSYLLIEIPFLRWRDQLLSVRKPVTEVASVSGILEGSAP